MRLEIRVHPGARSVSVGGTHEDALVVRVPEPAQRGRATAAALRAVADALGVRARDVHLVSGGASRRKVVEIDVGAGAGPAGRERAEQAVVRRLDDLRHKGADERRGPR